MKNAESDFMEGLLGSLNDIEDGSAAPNVSQQNYDETRNLLEGLNEIGLAYGNLLNPEDAPMQSQRVNRTGEIYEHQDDWEAAEQLSSHYAQVPGEYVFEEHTSTVQSNHSYQQSPKTSWSLVEEAVPGVKTMKMYSIKSNHSGQVIMDGMMMFEAAQTIVNLLNEGRTISDFRVLGIISSGLQYTTVMNEAIKSARKRQAVLKESKYDVAKELDGVIANKKKEAQKLKERVVTFLVDEGYITK